jgi:CRP-like cAMP-binding protein
MENNQEPPSYRIWGVDDVVYGPVDEQTLREWIRDERVAGGTWVFSDATQQWQTAVKVAGFQSLFPETGPGDTIILRSKPPPQIKPGTLRRVKILADLADASLLRLLRHVEIVHVEQFREVVSKGDIGDSLFMVLEGELRVRLMIGGKETILSTLGLGDMFGEVSVFDHGPRSADVVANTASTLLKISETVFQTLLVKAPELAAPILFNMGQTLAARIRADNRRLQDSIALARAVAG